MQHGFGRGNVEFLEQGLLGGIQAVGLPKPFQKIRNHAKGDVGGDPFVFTQENGLDVNRVLKTVPRAFYPQ